MNRNVDELRILCREEAHQRACIESRELARDDVKQARLRGAAAHSFFDSRMKHHYDRLNKVLYDEIFIYSY